MRARTIVAAIIKPIIPKQQAPANGHARLNRTLH